MEEFPLPMAIPHAEVRKDKEIPFLGSYLSSFLQIFTTSPQCFTTFLSLLHKVAAGRIKNSLFREFPQTIPHRVCQYSLFAGTELCPVSKKPKGHVHPTNTM